MKCPQCHRDLSPGTTLCKFCHGKYQTWYEPSPEEIAEKTAIIRAGWTETQRLNRLAFPENQEVLPVLCNRIYEKQGRAMRAI